MLKFSLLLFVSKVKSSFCILNPPRVDVDILFYCCQHCHHTGKRPPAFGVACFLLPVFNKWYHCDDKHITETNLLTLLNNVFLVFYAKEVDIGT